MQLAEEGRLELDAPIKKYLPQYPVPQGEQVTVHHLLTHTSGIPNYTSLAGFIDFTRNPYTPDSFLSVFANLELAFTPGSQFDYSNSGYFILGAIIERLTGQPFGVTLRARLLEPLGLDDTGYDDYSSIKSRMAVGYVKNSGQYVVAPYLDTSIPYAAGMMYSTVEDLFKWTLLLHKGTPFNTAESLQLMTTPYLNDYGYGLGVFYRRIGEDSVKTIAHSGGIFGYASYLSYMPEDDRVIVVLDNTEGNAGALALDLQQLLYDQSVAHPKRPFVDTLAAVIETEGITRAVSLFNRIITHHAEAWDFDENQLSSLGQVYLEQGDAKTAIRVFDMNRILHQESWRVFDDLGEAYLKYGDREAAIKQYKIAFEYNPLSIITKSALIDLGVALPPDSMGVPEDKLLRYVGLYSSYADDPTLQINISCENDQLYMQEIPVPPRSGDMPTPLLRIYPRSDTAFFSWSRDIGLEFLEDEQGLITGLSFRHGDQTHLTHRIQ